MERSEKIRKKFDKTYLELLEASGIMKKLFMDDLPQFTAKFPFMNATYLSDFETAINDADAAPDDEAMLSNQRFHTQTLAQQRQAARNVYTVLLTYVTIAFPRRADVAEHFGKKKYLKARANNLLLIELLRHAHTTANNADYKPMLIAKGFFQDDIDNIFDTSNALENAAALQQSAKINRSVMAQARVEKFNTLYNFMQEISSASKVVFMNNYAKQRQYKLYKKSAAAKQQAEAVAA